MNARGVVVVGYPGAELLDIACVTSTLDLANRFGADPAYRVRVVTPAGRAITSQSGLTLASQGSLERQRGPIDTLIVSGGYGYDKAAADPELRTTAPTWPGCWPARSSPTCSGPATRRRGACSRRRAPRSR